MAFTAVFDACVLYPAPLRDLLMQLATTELFRARWTGLIHDEWIRAACANRPDIDPAKWTDLRALMDTRVEDCLVRDFEPLIDVITLPDANDRHVVAAAVKCGADVIVTFNLKDFPTRTLGIYGMEAQHPDDFVRHLIDLQPSTVVCAAKTVRARLKNPAVTADDYLRTLQRQGLTATVAELRGFRDVI
jgi:hypothetical protein